MTYCCDKLCNSECCAPLRAAIDWAQSGSPFVSHPRSESAMTVVHDPAKLAELGAMALRARGVDIKVCGKGVFPWQWSLDINKTWIETLPPDVPERVIWPLPQFRAILARIMATPADESSREQCAKLIRGDT